MAATTKQIGFSKRYERITAIMAGFVLVPLKKLVTETTYEHVGLSKTEALAFAPTMGGEIVGGSHLGGGNWSVQERVTTYAAEWSPDTDRTQPVE